MYSGSKSLQNVDSRIYNLVRLWLIDVLIHLILREKIVSENITKYFDKEIKLFFLAFHKNDVIVRHNIKSGCNILTCECSRKHYIPQRWLQAILGMFVIIMVYCMRVCIHLAIVRIVKNTTKAVSKSKCAPPNSPIRLDNVKYGNHDWNQSVQSWIIAAFYYGYFPLNLLAGILSDRFGSRWILSTGILVSLLCCSLIPISADRVGYLPVIFLRFVQGCGQGVVFPAISSTLGRWVPPQERSTIAAVTYTGIPIGSVLGILLTGVLMQIFDGWKIVFYFWSGISLILYFILMVYFYSNPNQHPFITQREKDYLYKYMVRRFNTRMPYKAILKDGAVIATVFGQIGHVIVLFFFISYLPKFMDNVLRHPVADNAIISSLPFIGCVIMSVASGKLADWGIAKKHWDIGFMRKLYTVLSNIGPAACVVGIGYSGCDHTLVVLFCFLALVLAGFHNAGIKVNTLDLTTQYAGFAMALPNGIGYMVGALVPTICGYFAPDNTVNQWRFIFWILCITSIVTTLFYIAMGSGKRRRWDYFEDEQVHFTGKVPLFSCCDGVDKDRELLEAAQVTPEGQSGQIKIV